MLASCVFSNKIGKNFSKKFLPFQFNITIAVLVLLANVSLLKSFVFRDRVQNPDFQL
jgi:hypothetical protein